MKKSKFLVGVAAFCLFASLPVMALAADPKTVEHEKQVNLTTNGEIAPASIGAGTISCSDGGGRILYCPWNYTSTSKITYSNIYVEFSDYWFWASDYPVNPPVKTIYDVAEDPVEASGYYTATLAGSITTLDGVYNLTPVKSAKAYVK